MARMPRGEPRSVPDPVVEAYDKMLRQEGLKKQRAEAPEVYEPRPPEPPPFSPFQRLDDVRQTPRSMDTITIGGHRYREFDNGRANVLAPFDDPLLSQAELAERRRGLQNVALMTQSPLAALAYGAATVGHASPEGRDRALAAGALSDAALLAVAPQGARGVRIAPPMPRLPIAYEGQEAVRIRNLNERMQATGVAATLTSDMLGHGSKADRRLTPPGWRGHGTRYDEARGHLVADSLGITGRDPRNIVTLTQKGPNNPQMSNFEGAVRRRVRSGEVVEYSSTPLYKDGVLRPSAVLVTATGSRAAPAAKLILNPPRPRR